MCFPCTTSVCGAKDTGVSALRMLNGPQYTSSCTATEDSQCKLCESIDSEVLFTANGGAIADWCSYGCAPGSTRCGTCIWDPFAATVFPLTANNHMDNHIPFEQKLMVRFTGDVSINTAQFGTVFGIKMNVIAKNGANNVVSTWNAPIVLQLFPVVPPSSLTNIQKEEPVNPMIVNAPVQHFDITVEARDFTATSSFSDTTQIFEMACFHTSNMIFSVKMN